MESCGRLQDADRSNFEKVPDSKCSRTSPRFTVDGGRVVYGHLFETVLKWVCLSISLSLCLSISLCPSLSLSLSVSLSVCLSVSLSLSLSVSHNRAQSTRNSRFTVLCAFQALNLWAKKLTFLLVCLEILRGGGSIGDGRVEEREARLISVRRNFCGYCSPRFFYFCAHTHAHTHMRTHRYEGYPPLQMMFLLKEFNAGKYTHRYRYTDRHIDTYIDTNIHRCRDTEIHRYMHIPTHICIHTQICT